MHVQPDFCYYFQIICKSLLLHKNGCRGVLSLPPRPFEIHKVVVLFTCVTEYNGSGKTEISHGKVSEFYLFNLLAALTVE